MNEFVFEIRNLNKSFGPTQANKDINFRLRKGEIRGLIGENGSGKSTLITQIAGVQIPDSGEMYIDGNLYAPTGPLDAYECKISMVLQELGVVGSLPISANVFLGRMGQFKKGGLISQREMNKAAAAEFEKWGLPMPPLHSDLSSMAIESRKMVELTRALSIDPNILLLDEITQSLSMNNRQKLYGLLKKLKEMGRTVVLITHDVEEMIAITDTITVMRDGEIVGELVSAQTTASEVKQMMVGREVSGDYYRSDQCVDYEDEVVLSVKHLTVPGELDDVSFEVHAGEILGFCGLSDSGIHAVGKAVYGLSKPSSGSVHLVANEIDITNPMQALSNNIGYVPKDRDSEGMMIDAAVQENMVAPSLCEMSGIFGYVSPKKIRGLAKKMVAEMSVKCEGIQQPVNALSGGNKQKINLGRWLAKDLNLLILDCPTRGVDVGVKAYIYQLMKQAKKEKLAIILISDELPEALGMADRLIVMKDGKITEMIRRDNNMTEQSVIEVMI